MVCSGYPGFHEYIIEYLRLCDLSTAFATRIGDTSHLQHIPYITISLGECGSVDLQSPVCAARIIYVSITLPRGPGKLPNRSVYRKLEISASNPLRFGPKSVISDRDRCCDLTKFVTIPKSLFGCRITQNFENPNYHI